MWYMLLKGTAALRRFCCFRQWTARTQSVWFRRLRISIMRRSSASDMKSNQSLTNSVRLWVVRKGTMFGHFLWISDILAIFGPTVTVFKVWSNKLWFSLQTVVTQWWIFWSVLEAFRKSQRSLSRRLGYCTFFAYIQPEQATWPCLASLNVVSWITVSSGRVCQGQGWFDHLGWRSFLCLPVWSKPWPLKESQASLDETVIKLWCNSGRSLTTLTLPSMTSGWQRTFFLA